MAAWDNCFEAVTVNGVNVADQVATIKCLEPLFVSIVQAVLALSGVGLFVMLIVGGYTYLFSGGDAKKLEQAQHTITYAFLGIVVIIAAYLVLKTIGIFTGVPVTDFRVEVTP